MLVAFDRAPVIASVVILCREILVSGLREHLATLKVGIPVSRLAKWKTLIQMVAIGFLLVGPAGPWFVDPRLTTQAIGEILLWLAASLTLVTGYDYLVASIHHARAPEAAEKPDALVGQSGPKHRA
jgi:cardiolipin synthase